MEAISRRRLFAGFAGAAGGVVAGAPPFGDPNERLHTRLREYLSERNYETWFKTLSLDGFDGETVTLSTPVMFLRDWRQPDDYYDWFQVERYDDLLNCCEAVVEGAQRVKVVARQT